jgi:hypothetical protein
MMDWAAATAILAAIAVVVTLWLSIAESRRRAAEERARLKRDAISRMLTTMEVSIRRNQGSLNSLRFWSSPDLEYALAIPRLLHELGAENRHVSYWVFGEIQLMLKSTSDKGASEIGVKMCMKLVEWGHGAVPDDWFETELKSKPLSSPFHVSRRSKLLRGFNRLRTAFVAFAALTVMGGALFKTGQTVSKF